MKLPDRKAALAAYKERKIRAGVFRIRCTENSSVWIGAAPDLDSIWNRTAFSLRLGSHRCRSLQTSWTEFGKEAFAFEILESIDGEDDAHRQFKALDERASYWAEQTGGVRL